MQCSFFYYRSSLEDVKLCTVEANAAAKEIAFAVASVIIPSNLPQTDMLSHLEIKTVENEQLLVEVSPKGFRIANREGDCKYYDTPYALLSDISHGFRQKFSDKLISRLSELENE